MKDNSRSSVAYSSNGSMTASICNPIPRYLHHLMANTIFTRFKGQNKPCLIEVFLLWAILKDKNIDTGAFIFQLLVSQASSKKSRIDCGGLMLAITYAWAWGLP